MAVILSLLLMLTLFGCSSSPASTKLTNVVDTNGRGDFTCSFGEVERSFVFYLPENAKKNAPLIFVLHFYNGAAKGFFSGSGMKQVADKYGYAIVFPQGLADPNGSASPCWNSWLDENGNDDVGFLVSLAQYLQKTYNLSKDNTFVAGFSNGGQMAQALAVQAPDTFSAIASASASMNKGVFAQKTDVPVSVLEISGTNDGVQITGENSTDTENVEDIVNYWVATDGLDKQETKQLSERSEATYYSSDSNNNLVWYVEIENGGHSWPVESSSGFNASELVAEFFTLCIK